MFIFNINPECYLIFDTASRLFNFVIHGKVGEVKGYSVTNCRHCTWETAKSSVNIVRRSETTTNYGDRVANYRSTFNDGRWLRVVGNFDGDNDIGVIAI